MKELPTIIQCIAAGSNKKTINMKYFFLKLLFIAFIVSVTTSSCAKRVWPPTNGKNVGAERLLSGEKLPRVKKFKS